MPKVVKTDQVAMAIICYSLEELQKTKDRRDLQTVYSFDEFKSALLSEELLIDIRSIRMRWDSLKAKGVISEIGTPYDKALLYVSALERVARYTVPTMHAHTRTRTQKNQAEEASE